MFCAATVDVAERKKMFPAEMMQAGKFGDHIVALGRLLRLVQQLQRFGKAFAHPKSVREAKLRPA